LGEGSATVAIAETGEIADSYPDNSGYEGSLSRFQLGPHAAHGDAVCSKLTGGFGAQIRYDFAPTIAHAFDISDQEQLVSFERGSDRGSGIIAVHVERAAVPASHVVSNRRDHG
jgi:hypothetical protein